MLPKGLLKEYSKIFSLGIRILDLTMIIICANLAHFFHLANFIDSLHYWVAIFIAILLTFPIFSFFRIYQSMRAERFFNHAFNLFGAFLMLSASLAAFAFFTKTGEHYSRLWFLLWMLLSLASLIIIRMCLLLFLRFMRSHGLNERRVVIFGAGSLGQQLANTISQALWTGFKIIAFIDDFAINKPKQINTIPVYPIPKNLSHYLSQETVDEIWIAIPLKAQHRVKEILYELRHQTIQTRFILDIFGLDLLNHSITDIAGFPVLNIRSSPMVGIDRLLKAIEDRLIAFAILIFISPLFVLIAFLIKLSSRGPIFFKQDRLGWDGKIITVYKFRTMFLHEEPKGKVTQASINDKRITFIGKFLRKASLDELPQFINVLQGRMSIVGPRPHAIQHNEFYKNCIPIYMQRHQVKPGITGWAQVNGWRGETDTVDKMKKRVEYDLYYINNWSIALDLKIIFLTFIHGFINKNAY